MKNILLPLFIILSAIVNIQAQFISKANYALAEKFRNIGLGSLFAQNSMTIYPRFIMERINSGLTFGAVKAHPIISLIQKSG